MDKAVVITNAEETVMTASEFNSSGCRRLSPYVARTYCPCCRQPVYFAAGEFQTPHFRHQRNNLRAKWCDLFSQNRGGNNSQYDLISPPLFIRQEIGRPGSFFVVELGLKRIKDTLLATLESEGATLVVDDDPDARKRKYRISKERFGGGMTKIRINLSPNYSFAGIRLANSSKHFWDVWGVPCEIGRSIVFLCDRDTLSGRRVEEWDCVAVGDSVIIASVVDERVLKQSFPDIEEVGYIASRFGRSGFHVYFATVSQMASAFLEGLSIDLRQIGSIPEILWPPSLLSTGEAIPLFSESYCLYEVRSSIEDGIRINSKLYAHMKADVKKSSAVPLERTFGTGWTTAAIHPVADICFLSTRDWAFSNVILVGFGEQEKCDRLSGAVEQPQIRATTSGCYEISAQVACRARLIDRHGAGAISHEFLSGDVVSVTVGHQKLLRILGKVALPEHGERALLDLIPSSNDEIEAETVQPQVIARLKNKTAGLAQGKRFAEKRIIAVQVETKSADLEFATTRKALK